MTFYTYGVEKIDMVPCMSWRDVCITVWNEYIFFKEKLSDVIVYTFKVISHNQIQQKLIFLIYIWIKGSLVRCDTLHAEPL